MALELAKMNLKWGKENNDLKNLISTNTQKKETTEIRAMMSKNKIKQSKEKEDLQLRMFQKNN